jgi:hypothetical protein
MIRRPLAGLLILTLAVAGVILFLIVLLGGGSGTGGPQFSEAAKKRFTPVKSPARGPDKGRAALLRGR